MENHKEEEQISSYIYRFIDQVMYSVVKMCDVAV